MNTEELICLAFAVGYALAWLSYHKPLVKPNIEANLVITPEVLKQLNMALVNAYLDQHGLTWQPKGAVFDLGKEIKK